MKLASLKSGRDGQLVVVSRDLTRAVSAAADRTHPAGRHGQLGRVRAEADWPCSMPCRQARWRASLLSTRQQVAAPLPRCYHWADGSAYVTHVELVRKARGAELPDSFWTDPLMYMGASDAFIGANEDVLAESEDWGIDFEAEVVVFTDDVPGGHQGTAGRQHIKLVALVNDVSLRNLIPAELAKQFGFYQSKPQTSFTPVAVTPDELGDAWDGAKLHLPLISTLNGKTDRLTQCRCRYDLRFRPADPARCQEPRTDGGHGDRLGHGCQPGQPGRLLLPGGSALPGDHCQRQTHHAVHVLRRSHRDRDEGQIRRFDLWQDRPADKAVFPAELIRRA